VFSTCRLIIVLFSSFSNPSSAIHSRFRSFDPPVPLITKLL
jgi:hypothetical protein